MSVHPLVLAAEKFGTQQALAAELHVSKGALHQWKRNGVPIERCVEIERLCGRSVMRWHLRPDDWHRIWPELIGAEGAPTPTPNTTAEALGEA